MIRTAIACFLCGSLVIAPINTGLLFGQTLAADAAREAKLDFGRFAELSSTRNNAQDTMELMSLLLYLGIGDRFGAGELTCPTRSSIVSCWRG